MTDNIKSYLDLDVDRNSVISRGGWKKARAAICRRLDTAEI